MITITCDLNSGHIGSFSAWINVVNSKPRTLWSHMKTNCGPRCCAGGLTQVSSSFWECHPWRWHSRDRQRWNWHRYNQRWSAGVSLKGLSPKSWSRSLIATVELHSCNHPGCCCFLVAKRCLILCDPMDYSPPGSSVHGSFHARILE